MISHDPQGHVDTTRRTGELIGGRYRLESLIGHGALGAVWRARHITMGREVAVKLLRPDISGHPAIRRRLIQRVHMAQGLSHPNNCRLFDFGQSEGSLFLVQELLHGAPLRTIIERGAPYPVGWVLDIGLQILDGLGEAHEQGIVHRNLKPRNIFLLPRRRGGQQVKITDYGLASSLDTTPEQDPEDDREAEICGTAAYLAPETLVQQKSGKPTDVYAVALILLEMLTGRQAFRGDTLSQVLYRQIHTSVSLPPKLAWTPLGKALLQALSKHPDNRYCDADEFYEVLEQASQTTASYFRLDPADLEARDEAMPPEVLARMMRNQRARQKSERGGAGEGDKGSDDSEPHPGPGPGSDPAAWAFLPQLTPGASALVPPPFPLPPATKPRPAPAGADTVGPPALPGAPGAPRADDRPSAAGETPQAAPAAAPRARAAAAAAAGAPGEGKDVGRASAPSSPADPDLGAPAPDWIAQPARAAWVSRVGIIFVGLLLTLAALGLYMTVLGP